MKKFKREDLLHGGKLYYVKNKISKTTVVDVIFRCGARCDTVKGLAHFTEHMFFTGTKSLTKEEITKKYFDFINVNAYTSNVGITFTGNVFTEEFGDYLSTVAMLISESEFSQKSVDKEIGVVQQEISRNNDKFSRKAGDFNWLNLTGDDLYNDNILGTKETVASIKSKDVKDYVKKYFVAENLEVIVSSPLSLKKVKKLVQTRLDSKIPSRQNFKQLPLFNAYVKNEEFYEVKYTDIDKTYLYINFPIAHNNQDFKFKRKFNLVLDMINDTSEGIKKEIRLNKSLVYGGGISIHYNDKSGMATFSTECDKKNLNEIFLTVSEYFKNLKENGFTQAQLDKAKREYEYDEAYKEPRVNRLMDKLYNYRYYDKVVDTKWLKQLTKETTLDECNALFNEVFINPKISVSVYGNVKKSEIMPKTKFMKLFK